MKPARVTIPGFGAKSLGRGFTLVELIAVVSIIGILATIAVYSIRKYIQHAKSAEAAEIVGAIKAGQEAYYDETFQFLQIDSTTNGPEQFYPDSPTSSTGTGKFKIQWGTPSITGCTNCGTRYNALGVMPSAPVLFRYSCFVGAAGTNPAAGKSSLVAGDPFAATSTASQPFYVVNAVSDLDGNGSGQPMSAVVGTNLMGDLYSVNIGE